MNLTISKTLVLVLLLLMSNLAFSKQASQYLLTEKTYKVLTAAQELMAAENYAQAKMQLTTLLKKVKADSYDMAVVKQTLGYLYSSLEQYNKASELFQQALDSQALPEKVSHTLRYNLAQLLLAEERYQRGIALLKQWLAVEASPPSSAYVLLASAYYQLADYKNTARYIKIAINQDNAPQQVWYQVLLSAHLELKQYSAAIKVLETLIVDFPYQKMYWTQLSALHQQQNKELTALSIRALTQRLELTDGRMLNSLADMYRYLHIPYKSAQLLTKGMEDGVIESNKKNLSRLADSWLVAREQHKAAEVLKKLAKLDHSGKADLKYGRVLFNLEQWQQASEVLSKSIQKLTGKQVGTAALLSGLAQYHLGDFNKAKKLFNQAAEYKQESNSAKYWLNYIEQQLDNAASETS